jgi:hypothetical protein
VDGQEFRAAHPATFKAKVAALRSEKTLPELAKQFASWSQ